MSDLQDFIAQTAGVRLHRNRVLTAFSHVGEGPLLTVLFNQTRPAMLSKMQPVAATRGATRSAAKIVRRGMVDYRREL